jgi:3-oxoacyl-[acyl-carrier-protein] synthase-3
VGIVGTGSFLPPRCLTNADLEKMVDTSDEWIRARTGIVERRLADPDTATSDLAVRAARQALENAGVEAAALDLIIVSTVTPDMFFPSTASLVQHQLGAERAGAFDLLVGCTGFVYALSLGAQAIATGANETVLVVGAETLSKVVDWSDRATCVLFGDGAGAVVLRESAEGKGLLSYVLGNNGEGATELLSIPAGGSRRPASEETVRQGLHFLKMEGGEVFKFAVRIMEEASRQALAQAGLRIEDVDLLVPHQANVRIMDAAAKRLGLPRDRVLYNVERYGNTSSASIPIALDEAARGGQLRPGDVVVLVSFGAGLSWASAVLRW